MVQAGSTETDICTGCIAVVTGRTLLYNDETCWELDFGVGRNTHEPSLQPYYDERGLTRFVNEGWLYYTESTADDNTYKNHDLRVQPGARPEGVFEGYWYDFFWRSTAQLQEKDRYMLEEHDDQWSVVNNVNVLSDGGSKEQDARFVDRKVQYRASYMVDQYNRYLLYNRYSCDNGRAHLVLWSHHHKVHANSTSLMHLALHLVHCPDNASLMYNVLDLYERGTLEDRVRLVNCMCADEQERFKELVQDTIVHRWEPVLENWWLQVTTEIETENDKYKGLVNDRGLFHSKKLSQCKARTSLYLQQVIKMFPGLYWEADNQTTIKLCNELENDDNAEVDQIVSEVAQLRAHTQEAAQIVNEQLFPTSLTCYLSSVKRIRFDKALFAHALCENSDNSEATRTKLYQHDPDKVVWFDNKVLTDIITDHKVTMSELSVAISRADGHWNRDYITRMYSTTKITDERAGGVYSTLGSRVHTKCFARSLYSGWEIENDKSRMFSLRCETDRTAQAARFQLNADNVSNNRLACLPAAANGFELYAQSEHLCILQSYYAAQPTGTTFRMKPGDWCNFYGSTAHWLFVASNEFSVANDYAENLRAVTKCVLDSEMEGVVEISPELSLVWPFGTFSKSTSGRFMLYTTRTDLVLFGKRKDVDLELSGPIIVEYKTRMEVSYSNKLFTPDAEHMAQLILNYWMYYFCTGIRPIAGYIVYGTRRCRKQDVEQALQGHLGTNSALINQANGTYAGERGFVGSVSKLKLDEHYRPTIDMVKHINLFALQPLGKDGNSSYVDDHFLIPDMHRFLHVLGFKSYSELCKRGAKNRVELQDMDEDGMHKVFSQVLCSSKFATKVKEARDVFQLDESVSETRERTIVLQLKPEAFCVLDSDHTPVYPQVWPALRNQAYASSTAAIRNQAKHVSKHWLDPETSAAGYFCEVAPRPAPHFKRCTKCNKVRRVSRQGWTVQELKFGTQTKRFTCAAQSNPSMYRDCKRQEEAFDYELELLDGHMYSSFLQYKHISHPKNTVNVELHINNSVYGAPEDPNVKYMPLLFDPETKLPLLYCNTSKTLEIRTFKQPAPTSTLPSSAQIMAFSVNRLPIFRPECMHDLQFESRKWLSSLDPMNVNHKYCLALNKAVECSTRYICNRVCAFALKHHKIKQLADVISIDDMYEFTTSRIYKRNLTSGGPQHKEFEHAFADATHPACFVCGKAHNPLYNCQTDARSGKTAPGIVPQGLHPKLLHERQSLYQDVTTLPKAFQTAIRRCVNRLVNTRLIRAAMLVMGIGITNRIVASPEMQPWIDNELQAERRILDSISTYDLAEAEFWHHVPLDVDAYNVTEQQRYAHCSQRVWWTRAALQTFGHSNPYLMCTIEDHICDDLEFAIDQHCHQR